MGNTTAKQVGDFQAGVGKVGADIGVVTSTIIGVIMIIIAITMAIFALIPFQPWDCPDRVTISKNRVQMMCKDNVDPDRTGCNDARESLAKDQKYCSTKHRQLFLLFGLLLIPIALLIIWLSRWWRGQVHHSRTAAQVGGTLFEIGALQDLFGRN